MSKFLMEALHEGEWLPHSVWIASDIRVVLDTLQCAELAAHGRSKSADQVTFAGRRLRRVTQEEVEKLPADISTVKLHTEETS